MHPGAPLTAAIAGQQMTIRVQPPVDGGIKVSILPARETGEGLRVILADGRSLDRWARGAVSEQEFVYEWSVGTVPRE